jgi:hypothetical protein
VDGGVEEEDEEAEGVEASSFFSVMLCSFFSGSGCPEVEALLGGERSPGTSKVERSSPSSARTAMICPTGIFCERSTRDR